MTRGVTMRNKSRAKGDVRLTLTNVPVQFLSGTTTVAIAEGNNAAWDCHCAQALVGRCYFQFGHYCHTICPNCASVYRVVGDERKRAALVREIVPADLKQNAA